MEVTLLLEDELAPDTMLGVRAGRWEIVLVKARDGSISALEDRCTHARVRLSRGKLIDGTIFCVAHGARFDSCTGEALCFPAKKAARVFPVKTVDGRIVVEIPDEDEPSGPPA